MTYRTPILPRNTAPQAGSGTTGTGTRRRPVTKLFTIEEVAESLNVSSRTVRRLIDSGALPAHRLGRLGRRLLDVGGDDVAGRIGCAWNQRRHVWREVRSGKPYKGWAACRAESHGAGRGYGG